MAISNWRQTEIVSSKSKNLKKKKNQNHIHLTFIIFQNPDEDDINSSEDRISSSTDSDPLKVLEEQNDLHHDYNGDSGYEAESQRNGDDDNLFIDNHTPDTLTPPTPDESKMYYDISCVTYAPHESPSLNSTPRKLLIDHMEHPT